METNRRGGGVWRWVVPSLLGASLAATWIAAFADGMVGLAAWLLLISLFPLGGIVTLLGVGVYAGWRRRMSRPIALSLLLCLVAIWPVGWGFGVLPVAYPASLSETKPAATVRLPSDEILRVAWGGHRVRTNYHAATPDQRWAYDFLVEPAFHGSSRLEDYGCWGTPVLAPARGRVAAAHDGEPDEEPGKLSFNVKNALGNHVVLELETETLLSIAHLQQGSVAVEEGDMVEEGQVIGRCGNSGNTSEPHIHIHHHRPPRSGSLFAEGLPLYFRDHDGPPMPEGGFERVDGRPVLRGDVVRHVGSAQVEGAAEAAAKAAR